MNIKKTMELAPKILGTTMVKGFFALLFAIACVFMMFFLAMRADHQAQGASREQQIEKLRNEQIALERELVKVQDDWKVKEQAKIEAEKVFQEKLSELNTVTAAGNEIRTKITNVSKQAEEIRDSATGFTTEGSQQQ